MTTKEILIAAKAASPALAGAGTDKKNEALLGMAEALEKSCAAILKANALDVAAAKGSISDVMIDRLTLTEKRIADMAEASGRSPLCPTRWGVSSPASSVPTGLSSSGSALPWASLPSYMRAAPT